MRYRANKQLAAQAAKKRMTIEKTPGGHGGNRPAQSLASDPFPPGAKVDGGGSHWGGSSASKSEGISGKGGP